jgi:hypothetical protein
MEFRYMGFDQKENARTFRFDLVTKGEPNRRFTVTADLALFLSQRIAIQEAPSLCAQKLTSNLELGVETGHQLTEADLRAYANARLLAAEQKAEMRRNSGRRAAGARENSPWRGTRP